MEPRDLTAQWADLEHRFAYHAPTDTKAMMHGEIRHLCGRLAVMIAERTVVSREQSLAITALEECMMWANAAVARHPELESRGREAEKNWNPASAEFAPEGR
jgi:hypothetical protein